MINRITRDQLKNAVDGDIKNLDIDISRQKDTENNVVWNLTIKLEDAILHQQKSEELATIVDIVDLYNAYFETLLQSFKPESEDVRRSVHYVNTLNKAEIAIYNKYGTKVLHCVFNKLTKRAYDLINYENRKLSNRSFVITEVDTRFSIYFEDHRITLKKDQFHQKDIQNIVEKIGNFQDALQYPRPDVLIQEEKTTVYSLVINYENHVIFDGLKKRLTFKNTLENFQLTHAHRLGFIYEDKSKTLIITLKKLPEEFTQPEVNKYVISDFDRKHIQIVQDFIDTINPPID